MRYIGGKSLLLDNIYGSIQQFTDGTVQYFTDLFSGSGAVSAYMKSQGFCVTSNDKLYFSYVIVRGTVGLNKVPEFKKLKIDDPILYLNQIDVAKLNLDDDRNFIYQNYSPNLNCNRMYFQNKNALKIDAIRQEIEYWKQEKRINDDEYYYLLAALLLAVPFVANITGTFGAYLKYWDERTTKDLLLKKPDIEISKSKCTCFCQDYANILPIKTDLMYADPPYNSREYLPNYHIMETIARYDYPEIKGVTGIRNYSDQKSVFCKKSTVYSAFENLVKNSNTRYLLISYNNEGLISTEQLADLCLTFGRKNSFRLIEQDYRRYKNKIPNNKAGLKEQLYFIEK